MAETIIVEDADSIRTVTLNRPEIKNAINAAMWDELLEVFTDTNSNEAIRVLAACSQVVETLAPSG